MHADTRRILERYYAAFNARDLRAFADLLAEDVVHDINQGPREQGKEAFLRFMARMDAAYCEQVSDLVILTGSDGTRAAAEYTVEGTYLASEPGLPPASGQPYRLPGGAFFEVEEGRIRRVTNYYNLEAWLAQVS